VIISSQRPLPHNTHNANVLAPVGFEPTISAGERPQTYALDGAATGTGTDRMIEYRKYGQKLLYSPEKERLSPHRYHGHFLYRILSKPDEIYRE
jgi:hypothetical protein